MMAPEAPCEAALKTLNGVNEVEKGITFDKSPYTMSTNARSWMHAEF